MKSLSSMTKAQLIAEIQRLTSQSKRPRKIPRSAFLEYRAKPKDGGPIIAGMDLLKDDLLVVDEAKRIAYVHPNVKTVPHKIRIHGYAARTFKKGQQVRIRHWLTYDPP